MEERKLNIGVFLLGGLGDTVQLTMYLRGIKKQWSDSKITVYCRFPEVFRGNKDVDEFGTVEGTNWINMVEKKRAQFDIFYDLRYGSYAYYNRTSSPELTQAKIDQEEKFKKYRPFYYNFLHANSRLVTLDEPIWKIVADGVNIECDPDDMSLEISNADEDYVADFLKKRKIDKYITVHDWARFGKQTKCWKVEGWNRLIVFAKQHGYTIIQLGTPTEELMKGVINLLGRTNLHQSAAFIKSAAIHVDVEGGLVHVAKAIGQRSIVLFGPTPERLFCYAGNVPIRSGVCSPCFWKRANWYKVCMSGRDSACMKEIEPEQVIASLCAELELPVPPECLRYKTRKHRQHPDNPDKVLVKRSACLGDVLMTLPAVKGLREKYPNTTISYWTMPQNREVLAHLPFIDAVVDQNNGHRHMYDLDGVYENNPRGLSEPLRDLISESCGVTPDERRVLLELTPLERAHAKKTFEGFGFKDTDYVIGMHMRNWHFSNSRNLPRRVYEELLARLKKHPDVKVVLLGGDPGMEFPETDQVKDLQNKTTLRKLFAIIAACDVLVGPDSSMCHIAASVETPYIGVYGPVLPQSLAPFGADYQPIIVDRHCINCGKMSCETDCYSKITGDMFYEKIQQRRSIGSKKVSIVIAVYNQLNYTERCIEMIKKNTWDVDYELIIIDNYSTEGSMKPYLKKLSAEGHKIIYEPRNVGVAAAWNDGARDAIGEYICVLNNDTEPSPGWLSSLVKVLDDDPKAGVVGSKLLYPDGRVQHAGMVINALKSDFDHIHHGVHKNSDCVNELKTYAAVTGCVQLFRRADYYKVGCYEERYFAYFEDTDFCMKMQEAGFKVVYQPASEIVHHVSRTSSTLPELAQIRDRGYILFNQKWEHFLRSH